MIDRVLQKFGAVVRHGDMRGEDASISEHIGLYMHE